MFTSEQTKQEQYLTWWVTLFPLLPGEVFRQETCVWGVQEEVGERRLPPSSSWWGWKAISWETRWHKEGRLLHTETTLVETVKPLWRDNMLTWLSSVNYCLLTDWRYATLRMCNTSLYIVCHSSPTMRSDGIVCLSLGFGSFESSVMIPAIVKWLASPCNYWTWQYCIQKSNDHIASITSLTCACGGSLNAPRLNRAPSPDTSNPACVEWNFLLCSVNSF